MTSIIDTVHMLRGYSSGKRRMAMEEALWIADMVSKGKKVGIVSPGPVELHPILEELGIKPKD